MLVVLVLQGGVKAAEYGGDKAIFGWLVLLQVVQVWYNQFSK